MSEKPLVRMDVSSNLPQAVVFGADTFIGKSFLYELIKSQLGVLAVVKDESENFPDEVLVVNFDDWSKTEAKADYVIDFWQVDEAVKLSVKQGAKLLTVVDIEKKSKRIDSGFRPGSWRLIKTGFVYGPNDSLESSTFLNRIFIQAVLNNSIDIPFSEEGRVFPIYIDDLCQALAKSLFVSGIEKDELFIFGKSLGLAKLLKLVESQAQNDKEVKVDAGLVLPKIDSHQQIQESWQSLDWSPETSIEEGIVKTIQFLFQKKEAGELEFLPETESSSGDNIIEEEKVEQTAQKAEVKKEPVAKKIEKDYWQEKEAKKAVSKKEELPVEKIEEETVVVEDEFSSSEDQEDILPIMKRVEPEEKPQKAIKKEKVEQKSEKKISQKRVFGFSFLMIVFLVLFLAGNTIGAVFNIVIGSVELKKSVNLLKTQKFAEVEKVTLRAEKRFSRAIELATKRTPLAFFQISQAGKKASRSVLISSRLGWRAVAITKGIFQGGDIDISQEKDDIGMQIEQLSWQLGLLEADLSSQWSFVPGRWANLPKQYQKKISQARLGLEKTLEIIDSLDWILASNEQRQFLVLLQNNTELRPTGGFIGSFALLNFSDGQLVSFDVKDVYTADGQLKGHVEPPAPIKEILGEESWYLRDSNWNPDFPKSAQNAEWFIEKELGINPDGVIAFNLTAAQNIVGSLGEIYLADFDEKINKENLFERAEFYSETNFFPGSTQKASFLSVLGKQLFETIRTASPAEYLGIASAVFNSLEQKEILISTDNQNLNNGLLANNWDGRIKNIAAVEEGVFSDYIFLVEANLGVNKTNYFLRRSIEEMIDIKTEGRVDHILKVNYENTAQSSNWPGGDYKNYLRIYLPVFTKLGDVYIYDPLVAGDVKRPLSEDQLEQTKDEGKEIISFLVKVPVASRRTVEVHFSQNVEIGSGNWKYLRYFQKQSGFGSTPLTVLVSYPDGWQPLQVNPEATSEEGSLLFNRQLDGDIPFGIEFGR
jgi:hypothetical protein